MTTRQRKVLGTGIMLAMLLAASATFAQEPSSDDELMPAVDTSATVEEQDSEGPGPDVTRTTTGNRVMDSMQLSRTEITGNQELPKVLYIVPWKKSDPGDLMGRPANTLMDEVLGPVDREEFLRQVNYYNDLHGEEEEP